MSNNYIKGGIKRNKFMTIGVDCQIEPHTEAEIFCQRRMPKMKKFEIRLAVFALIFVGVYLGAAVITIQNRLSEPERVERLESKKITSAEGRLLMAELFLPMVILLTLTVCFIVVRKQRAKKLLTLDDDDEDLEAFPDEAYPEKVRQPE